MIIYSWFFFFSVQSNWGQMQGEKCLFSFFFQRGQNWSLCWMTFRPTSRTPWSCPIKEKTDQEIYRCFWLFCWLKWFLGGFLFLILVFQFPGFSLISTRTPPSLVHVLIRSETHQIVFEDQFSVSRLRCLGTQPTCCACFFLWETEYSESFWGECKQYLWWRILFSLFLE